MSCFLAGYHDRGCNCGCDWVCGWGFGWGSYCRVYHYGERGKAIGIRGRANVDERRAIWNDMIVVLAICSPTVSAAGLATS